jgi:single-stranded-DNA-specific exonuclease
LKKERRNWILPEPLRALPGLEAFSSVFRQILHGRGVTRPSQLEQWLRLDLDRGPDPFLLKDMSTTCDLIAEAVGAGDRIAIYGDYDADGVTAAVALANGLRSLGADVITYIPNRFTEGYGLNHDAILDLHQRGARLVITADCGSNSVDIARARPRGMQLVVTDHHEVGSMRPPVDALINPKQQDCSYPFKGLAACGVAFKLLTALSTRNSGKLDPTVSIDAIALGTVADVVPLQGENRAIVKAGLERLNESPSAGCTALLRAAGIEGRITSEHLAFQLGPRVNAAGRMEDAQLALDLLMANDPDAAVPLAERINLQNLQRQQATATILKDARQRALELPDDAPVIVLGAPDWPLGVIGLAAGKLVEEFYRPAFVFNQEGDEWRGSARGVEGFHMVEALAACKHLLMRYGGHAMAAGLTVHRNRWDALREALWDYTSSKLSSESFCKPIRIEAQAYLADIKPSLYHEIQQLAPFGLGNREPLLISRNVEVLRTECFGQESRHLRLQVRDNTGRAEAIAFDKGFAAQHLPSGRRIDLVYSLDFSRWEGLDRLRLHLKDLRPAEQRVLAIAG